jgi:Skp family chaperone for outer membrane proteins
MSLRNVAGAAGLALLLSGPATVAFSQSTTTTKIAIIDIERVAAESAAGKKLFEALKVENDKVMEERGKREQEIRDMTAKLNSEILSQDAKARLQRDIERKRTDAQRWLEDAQADFEAKRQEGEATFQQSLEPIVKAVASEHGIGLILRATPGLTFVLDPTLDISPLVVEKLDAQAATPPPGGGDESSNR